MSELPFLVVHGAVVWKVLLVLLVATTLVLWFRWSRWQDFGLVAVAATFCWYGVLYCVGRASVPSHSSDEPISGISSFGRVAIAAAMPGSREDAIDYVEHSNPTYDEAGFQFELAVDREFRGCAVQRLADNFDLEQALVEARRCGSPHEVAELLIGLGRYAEAATVVTASPSRSLVAFIGARRWKDAAVSAHEIASASTGERALAAECLGELLGSWSGDAAALELLDLQTSETCRVIAAAAHRRVPVAPAEGAARMLAGQLGADVDPIYYPDVYKGPVWTLDAGVAGETPMRAAYLRDVRAARALIAGNARRAARELDDPVEPTSPAHSELRAEVMIAGFVDAPVVIPESPFDQLFIAGNSRAPCAIAKALAAAKQGDGGPWCELLRRCRVYTGEDWTELASSFTRVRDHRDELARLWRYQRANVGWPFSIEIDHPFLLVWRFVEFRDLARALGDHAEVERWQRLIDRHSDAFGDRDRAVAFVIAGAL